MAEEGLALYRQLGDRHGIAILLRDLGIAAARTGDYDVALRCFEESAASFRELDERRQLATVIANIGDLAFKQGTWSRQPSAPARAWHSSASLERCSGW